MTPDETRWTSTSNSDLPPWAQNYPSGPAPSGPVVADNMKMAKQIVKLQQMRRPHMPKRSLLRRLKKYSPNNAKRFF